MKKITYTKIYIIAALVLLAGTAAFFIFRLESAARKVYPQKSLAQIVADTGQLIVAPDRKLDEEKTGEMQILLLGVGGNGQFGQWVTDTIILATIRFDKNYPEKTEIALTGIPRDYAIKLPDLPTWQKINAAYEKGEFAKPGLGPAWAIEQAERLTKTRIPYYAVIDFDAFRQAIDFLGGVDLLVERKFDDLSYPDFAHGTMHIAFEAGYQHMDGERALIYARSRHGTNGEGTDFRRLRRQQQIMEAAKSKIGELNPAASLGKLTGMLDIFAQHFRTNLEPWQLKRLYDIVRATPQKRIYSSFIDPSTGLVCSWTDPDTGLYLLRPCEGKTEADITTFFARRFELGRQGEK